MGSKELSIIVPLYNEEKIKQFYVNLIDSLTSSDLSYEIILVDDGSESAIAALYEEISHSDLNVKVVRHVVNRGQQDAIISGYEASTGNAVLTVDADVNVQPVDLKRFYEQLNQGNDVVFGIRNAKERPFFRRVISLCLNVLVSLIFGKRIHDIGCGFTMFSRRLFDEVLDYRKKTIPNKEPINILALYLAKHPCELIKVSGTISRKSRYSLVKLLKFSVLILSQLPKIRFRSSRHLASRDWDKVAHTIEISLNDTRHNYFRCDKLLCYKEFYGIGSHTGKVLDVGCGPGHFVLFCAKSGVDITGVDLSSGMLNLARNRLEEKGLSAELLQVDISKPMPFRDKVFDAVVCESVLNHVDAPMRLLREIKRVLKDDGELILDITNGLGIGWRTAIQISQWLGSYPKGSISWIGPVTARHYIRSAGFKLFRSRGLHLFPPPRITSIGFKSVSLLPHSLEYFLERQFFKLNHFLETKYLFKYLCFKYIIRCKKLGQ